MFWNPESAQVESVISNWNPGSTAWNLESNTVLDYLTWGEMFYTQHQYAYYPYCSPYVYKGADKEKLLQKQEPLWLEIVFFILVTSLFDSGVKL